MKHRKGFTLIELLVVIAIIALVLVMLWPMISGTGEEAIAMGRKPKHTADSTQAAKTALAMKEADRQVGAVSIVNFQEKKLAKMIYELRDQENLVCFAYLKSLEGKPVFLGKCIGFGLPYCVQFTNPERIAVNSRSSSYGSVFGTLPQPEPNGLFMPETLAATWLMMIDPKNGEVHPVYIEPEILVSPFPLI